jgi:transcriptional regulator with XRE-family HTH domain
MSTTFLESFRLLLRLHNLDIAFLVIYNKYYKQSYKGVFAMTHLADNLKYLRTKSNLSQQKIANDIGITQRKYSYYETGQNEPSLNILLKFERFFKCGVDLLIGYSLEAILNGDDKELLRYLKDKAEINNIDFLTKNVYPLIPTAFYYLITGKEPDIEKFPEIAIKKPLKELKAINQAKAEQENNE